MPESLVNLRELLLVQYDKGQDSVGHCASEYSSALTQTWRWNEESENVLSGVSLDH